MSWDSYIDNLMAQAKDSQGTAHCDQVCIIGLDGGALWTSLMHENALRLEGTEASNIARCFQKKDFTLFQANGIHVGTEKYQFLRSEEDGKLVLGKKKDFGSLTLQASKTAIVIAHTKEGCQHGTVNKAVSVIAEYLESMNM